MCGITPDYPTCICRCFVAATTAPRSLKYSSNPPHTVTVMWSEPETPNGVIRYYIVEYMLSDGTGNKTRFKFVKEHMQEIGGLIPSTNYNVTVQAFTVGVGPAASITVMAAAISKFLLSIFSILLLLLDFLDLAPTPPQNLRSSSTTSSSITLQWKEPLSFNGAFDYYTVSEIVCE